MPAVNTRTVNQLINDAFKIIGMFTEDRTPQSFRQIEAINILNEIIDELETSPILIPYFKTLIFNATPSKGSYTIGEETGVDINFKKPTHIAFAQTIYNNSVQPIQIISENIYYDAWSIKNCTGRPIYCWLERGNLVSTLNLYPAPSLIYGIVIRGKFGIDNLYNGDILSDKITPSYYSFLAHSVARRLHENYPVSIWSDVNESTYKKLLGNFTSNNDVDLSIKNSDDYPSIGYPIFNWGA